MKKKEALVILASSRSKGHTRQVIDILCSKTAIDLVDINSYDIGYFDYDLKNKSDDFMSLVKTVLNYDTIIFATPVYWYTMSAQMKTFFDRLSDLLIEGNKDVGRQLRGKNMVVLSCGSDEELFDGFEMPFKQSANYLGMNYLGHIHTWIETSGQISEFVKSNLENFVEQLNL